MDTGFPDADARDDFTRARRRQVLARLAARLRGQPGDVDVIVPFDEVVVALGRVGERSLGLQTIDLDTIVGTVDRSREFDRRFRPTSTRARARFEQIAAAERRGQAMPPIDVYRVGAAHFVRDGHHRVAVARARRRSTIDARVTEIVTRSGAEADLRITDLPVKTHERLLWERVPLPADDRLRLQVRSATDYGLLAEGVEAWGFRLMQAENQLLDRPAVARRWFAEEYVPVVAMLKEAGLIPHDHQETEAYLRLAADRYRLLRTHAWDASVIEALRHNR
jgi:hypothetical protein